jgi:hypothetical protein
MLILSLLSKAVGYLIRSVVRPAVKVVNLFTGRVSRSGEVVLYRVRINYLRISLRYNLSSKCRKIVKFVSITHSERNIWNGPIVATDISREKRKPVLEGSGCQNTPIIYTHPVFVRMSKPMGHRQVVDTTWR